MKCMFAKICNFVGQSEMIRAIVCNYIRKKEVIARVCNSIRAKQSDAKVCNCIGKGKKMSKSITMQAIKRMPKFVTIQARKRMPKFVTVQVREEDAKVCNCKACMKQMILRWVLDHKVINPKYVWTSRRSMILNPNRIVVNEAMVLQR